jgi:hypothetical protein
MVRDVSGKEEAEMKWTKPETLVGNYGVKVVGWPGYDGMVSSLVVPSGTGIGTGSGSGSGSGQNIVNAEQHGDGDGDETINQGELGLKSDGSQGETTLANAQVQEEGDKIVGGDQGGAAGGAAAAGGAGAEDEELIPLRNPSNNSVK